MLNSERNSKVYLPLRDILFSFSLVRFCFGRASSPRRRYNNFGSNLDTKFSFETRVSRFPHVRHSLPARTGVAYRKMHRPSRMVGVALLEPSRQPDNTVVVVVVVFFVILLFVIVGARIGRTSRAFHPTLNMIIVPASRASLSIARYISGSRARYRRTDRSTKARRDEIGRAGTR